ncbi:hypothetical protein CALVIDRAFT_568694 [Calocera viscosa TUFC12733]|uniref:Uncharacterized protein n=1 Tax=Calocera viscosa (strain TUFC12733) TaxID=1330018 RepID=A0A167GUD2_CALVF|nr:hypothetical protein CALVIDRAFT_568694 [Calocera viscosa TUFC12733]
MLSHFLPSANLNSTTVLVMLPNVFPAKTSALLEISIPTTIPRSFSSYVRGSHAASTNLSLNGTLPSCHCLQRTRIHTPGASHFASCSTYTLSSLMCRSEEQQRALRVDLHFFPVDTLKTRLQSAQRSWRAGGLSRVYRGVGSVVVGSAPGGGMRSRGIFHDVRVPKRSLLLLPASSDNSVTPAGHILAVSLAEIAACLVHVPIEVVKSAAQTGAHAHP